LSDFSFQTQFLQFVWISNNKIHSKKQHLPHLSSENCEINFTKFHSPKAFQQSPNSNIVFSFGFIYFSLKKMIQ
jgi:hypothetical protein